MLKMGLCCRLQLLRSQSILTTPWVVLEANGRAGRLTRSSRRRSRSGGSRRQSRHAGEVRPVIPTHIHAPRRAAGQLPSPTATVCFLSPVSVNSRRSAEEPEDNVRSSQRAIENHTLLPPVLDIVLSVCCTSAQ